MRGVYYCSRYSKVPVVLATKGFALAICEIGQLHRRTKYNYVNSALFNPLSIFHDAYIKKQLISVCSLLIHCIQFYSREKDFQAVLRSSFGAATVVKKDIQIATNSMSSQVLIDSLKCLTFKLLFVHYYSISKV